MEGISELKSRLTKATLIDNILECLYFLAEFSYKEIASKRKRATDEIESVLNTSISGECYINNWYEQNLFIKEQMNDIPEAERRTVDGFLKKQEEMFGAKNM